MTKNMIAGLLAFGLIYWSPGAAAQESEAAARAESTAAPQKVGGHVGIATPLVSVSTHTTSIADQFTLLVPIGIGFNLNDRLVFDFETVVSTPVSPAGTSGLVVDPGLVWDAGAVALGLRVAFQINAHTNVGLIPLIHKGLVDLGGSTWFVEAAFPSFWQDKKATFNAVLHTGIGF